MKKLSFLIIASSVLTCFFVIAMSGRGYTKDNLSIYKSNEQKCEEYYNTLNSKVVQIYTTGEKSVSFGTGFFIDNKKTIVTNYHVVKDANNIYIMFKDDSYAYRAELIAFDSKSDIALLTSKEDFEYDSLQLSFDTKRNQNIYSCGFSLNYIVAPGTITDTIVRYEDNNYIQTDIVLKRGNSGGPVLNEKGEVIGMVTLGNKTASFLVPSSKIMNLIYSSH